MKQLFKELRNLLLDMEDNKPKGFTGSYLSSVMDITKAELDYMVTLGDASTYSNNGIREVKEEDSMR